MLNKQSLTILLSCLCYSSPAGLTFLELYWSVVGFVYYFVGVFICTGGDLWCPVYVICCLLVLYYHSGELWCPVDVICHNFFIVQSRFFLIHYAAVILLYIYPVFAVNRPNRKITVHNRAVMQSRCRLGLKRVEQLTGRQQPEMNPGPWLCESNHGLLPC